MSEEDIAPVLGPIGSLVEHAYSYAGLGFEVFPVNPTDKTPLTSQRQATTDLDTIEAWWSRWPGALIGHRLPPDQIILDIDPRHGGKATWEALKAESGMPVTRVHMSGRGDGGGHVWFLRPDDHLTITKLDAWAKEHGTGHEVVVDGAKARWVCGIDILHHNHRYTILPPSLHPDTGQPYRWGRGKGLAADVAPMPQMLVDLLVRDQEIVPPRPPSEPDPSSPADWFSATHAWSDLLRRHGWLLVGGDGESDGSRWRHPTSENRAHSATLRHGCLFVYSPNTPFEVTSDGEPHGYTLFKAFATLEHHGDMSSAARAARKLMPAAREVDSLDPKASSNGQSGSARRLALTPAAGIPPRRVRWCWEGRLAIGTLGLLAGPEGLGKSTLGYTIAADVTRGELRGEYLGRPRSVLVCATEDSWEHTIVPRLMAARADLERIYRVEVVLADDIMVGLSLPLDLAELEHAAREVDAALLILDPLMSRLDGVLDTHRDADVRRALEPLVSVADNTDMSILGLIHHNKSGGTDPLSLVMASKAFTAVARSVHTVIKDPDDETGLRKYFGSPKNNLGRADLPTMSFVIESWSYDTEDGPGSTGRLVWGEERSETIADILVRSARGPEEKSALDEAAFWLEDYLTDRQMRARAGDAISAGKAAGHSESTIHRARKKLGIETSKTGYQGAWMWILAKPPKVPDAPQDPEAEFLTSLAPSGLKDIASIKEVKGVSPHARETPLENGSEPESTVPFDQIEASDAFRRGAEKAAAQRQTITADDLL